MFIFEHCGKPYCFIHIPKCSGKFVREYLGSYQHLLFEKHYLNKSYEECIETLRIRYPKKEFPNIDQYKMIKSNWHIGNNNIDLAHIPFCKKNIGLENTLIDSKEVKYFTFVRNPYDRIVSAYIYKTGRKNAKDFKIFVKTKLINMNFTNYTYHHGVIHYCPQYLFLVNDSNDVDENIEVFLLETYHGNFIGIEKLVPKTYNHQEYFDGETLEIINTIYKKDFELFEYEMISKASM